LYFKIFYVGKDDAPQQDANQQVFLIESTGFPSLARFPRCPRQVNAPSPAWIFSDDATLLKMPILLMPAARCPSLFALLSRLGAFFNPKLVNQIRLFLTAIISFADMGYDVLASR
jgi:hypothetical protein